MKKKAAPLGAHMFGSMVLVRTYSAGVHFGKLVARRGRVAELTDARRIWSWVGANTLNEIAIRGVGPGSKISEPVERIVLTEAIEIIPIADVAVLNLRGGSWGR